MDLAPFARINPCGYAGLEVTQLSELGGPESLHTVSKLLVERITRLIGVASQLARPKVVGHTL